MLSEKWDLMNADRVSLNKTHTRGTPLKKGEYHLVVEIWTFNSNGEILLTLRHPEKEAYPNYWENTGGSALAGETSIEAAVRELEEETGITASPDELIFIDSVRAVTAFHDIYLLKKDWPLTDIKFQDGETVDAQWVSLDQMDVLMLSKKIAPPITRRFQAYRQCFIEKLTVLLEVDHV